ncbi:Thioesterase-like protein TwmA [Cladobotryum mycophilum]|uniref:Thioesterase-like protein TwmA n=1 Tax=Cladobotryum mycophilum TaxID=491253 RepID=A0ABR0SXV7_9HYPO
MEDLPAKIPSSLEVDSRITRLDDNTFAANLTTNFCIGAVPNGGYVATIFLRVAREYLSPRRQLDTVVSHWEFLNRTAPGPVVLVVEEVKPGRSMTVLHVSLYQGALQLDQHPWITPGKSQKVVSAYLTNRLIEAEEGLTLSTGWSMQPPPPPPPAQDFELLRVSALRQMVFYTPRHGQQAGGPSPLDCWMRMLSGERFTNPDLGFVVDATAAMIPEAFRPKTRDEPVREGSGFPFNKRFWYPTLAMNMDVKRALPEEGEEWLFLRTQTKQIYNGRFDTEVLVLDKHGRLIAISQQTAMMVDFDRNTKLKASKESKI